jgi:L-asparaginase / beta-aspartyl-peptidase
MAVVRGLNPILLAALAFACAPPPVPATVTPGEGSPPTFETPTVEAPTVEAPAPSFALAVHGGAGSVGGRSREQLRPHVASLTAALREGCALLDGGGKSLDVVERVVRLLEDDPLFNAGKGAVFTREGRHELDASIMDGRTRRSGAVAGVRTVKNPIALARAVMERTRHVLLAGEGADAFAQEVGMEPVPNEYFSTEERRQSLQRHLSDEGGTVGAVAFDRHGDLAAATSTGGLTGKRWGRVGDSPIIGAGTFADNQSCAVSCTGIGEEILKSSTAHAIAMRMTLGGEDIQAAAEAVLGGMPAGSAGVIAVSRRGEIALVHNTETMFRGACDAEGRLEVRIWADPETLPGRDPVD